MVSKLVKLTDLRRPGLFVLLHQVRSLAWPRHMSEAAQRRKTVQMGKKTKNTVPSPTVHTLPPGSYDIVDDCSIEAGQYRVDWCLYRFVRVLVCLLLLLVKAKNEKDSEKLASLRVFLVTHTVLCMV